MSSKKKKELIKREINRKVHQLYSLLNTRIQYNLDVLKKEIINSNLPIDLIETNESSIDYVVDDIFSRIYSIPKTQFESNQVIFDMIKEIKRGFNLTQQELALILGVSLRTVAGWLNLESTPQNLAQDRVKKVHKIYYEIFSEVRPEARRKWLFVKNEILGNSVFDLLTSGDFEEVISYIDAFKEGVYL